MMILVRRRMLPVALVGLWVATAVACKGGGGDHVEPLEPTATADPLAGDPAQALQESATRVLTLVQAGQADFDWQIERDGFDINGDGRYAQRSPRDLSLKTHYRGDGELPQEFHEANDSELLVVGDSIFLKTPPLGDGWFSFTTEQFGADWDVVQSLVAAHSPVSYESLVGNVAGDVDSYGMESIDDGEYLHYIATVDANILMTALADAYGSQGQVMFVDRFSGPIPIDIWIDPVTLLPRRLSADTEFTFMDGLARLALTVNFVDWSSPGDFPAPPQDATAF